MDKNGKQYIYYVASLNRYELIPANNVREAIEIADEMDMLQGQTLLNVRIASKEEIDSYKFLLGNKKPQLYIKVEYDPQFAGGDYDGVGEFVYIPMEVVDHHNGDVRQAFMQSTGLRPKTIIHYSPDELYTAEGQPYDETQ